MNARKPISGFQKFAAASGIITRRHDPSVSRDRVRPMAFDNIFKLTMRELIKSCDAKAEKVGTLPLEIDTVARCDGHQHVCSAIPLLMSHFSAHNLLEYKSERDKPTGESLSKLLGYVG